MWKSLLVGTVIAFGLAVSWIWITNERFDSQAEKRITAMLERRSHDERIVNADDLRGLPAPVKHWLETSGVLGQPMPTTVRLQQQGEIRVAPDKPWMPFHADQYYVIDPPSFLWRVSASAPPALSFEGSIH